MTGTSSNVSDVSDVATINPPARALKATKTGRGRRFNIEPTLLPLLRAMHEAAGGRGNVIPIRSERAMARDLRRWLKHSGVTRTELHDTKCKTSRPLAFHDLRATGLTWMAVRGDDPLKIIQRAGHSNFGRRKST
jgi:integrase